MKLLVAIVALLVVSFAVCGQQPSVPKGDAADLVKQFKNEEVFWKQIEIAKQIVALHDKSVLTELSDWLSVEDRHVRGNAAFIFAALGDDRGFYGITAILEDKADRPIGQGIPGGNPTSRAQIRADRYYAAHLLGDLKDPRAVPILIPLLHDPDLAWKVPWSLGQIGDHRADQALIEVLSESDPSMRVLAIYALEKLNAKTALPRLRELQDDQEKSNFGDTVRVGDAAKAAIAKLESTP